VDGGGGWPDPLDRPAEGWGESHIDWFGSTATGDVNVLRGQVSGAVARLILDPGGANQSLEIDPVTGAYLAGNETAQPLRLVAYDEDRRVVDEAEVEPPPVR